MHGQPGLPYGVFSTGRCLSSGAQQQQKIWFAEIACVVGIAAEESEPPVSYALAGGLPTSLYNGPLCVAP